jgi:hypothetical protein
MRRRRMADGGPGYPHAPLHGTAGHSIAVLSCPQRGEAPDEQLPPHLPAATTRGSAWIPARRVAQRPGQAPDHAIRDGRMARGRGMRNVGPCHGGGLASEAGSEAGSHRGPPGAPRAGLAREDSTTPGAAPFLLSSPPILAPPILGHPGLQARDARRMPGGCRSSIRGRVAVAALRRVPHGIAWGRKLGDAGTACRRGGRVAGEGGPGTSHARRAGTKGPAVERTRGHGSACTRGSTNRCSGDNPTRVPTLLAVRRG